MTSLQRVLEGYGSARPKVRNGWKADIPKARGGEKTGVDRSTVMRFATGFLTALMLLVLTATAVIWTGAYNVAASSGHSALGKRVLDTALERSVKSRAEDSAVPVELIRKADLRAGFREFQEYCVHCHGAPGVQAHQWASGMTPDPPELSKAAGEWTSTEIFWIVKHGIKMTGMPSFGDSESDETIANIAAFVDRMEGMRPEQYAALQRRSGSPQGHAPGGDSHSHDSGSQH